MARALPRPGQKHHPRTFSGLSRLSREVIFEDPGTPTPSGTRPASILTDRDSRASYDTAHRIPYNPDYPEEVDVPLLTANTTQATQSPPLPLPPGAGVIDSAIYLANPWKRGGRYSQLETLAYDDTSPTGFDPQKLYSYSPGSDVTQFLSPSNAEFPGSSFFKSPTAGLFPPSPGFPRRSRQHPFAKGCEPPQWRSLTVHVALCGLAYPFLLAFAIAATGKTLFWARLIVGVGSGVLGLMLGVSLMALARRMLEAASTDLFFFHP